MLRHFQTFFACLIVFAVLAGPQTSYLHAQTLDKAISKADVKRNWEKAGWEFPKGWKPTDDEAAVKTWGEEFAQSIATDDLKAAAEFSDFQNLLTRCVRGVESEGFRKGFTQGAAAGGTGLIAKLAEKGMSYEFRGVKQTPYGPCALMRMLDASGACNYHLWRLQENPSGKVVGADLYIFLTGESFGDTMRRIALISVPKGERNFFQKLVGAEKEMSKHQIALMDMLKATQTGDSKTILETYETLPKSLKREKFIVITRLSHAFNGSEEEYVEAIEDFQDLFPNDPAADLATLDLHFIKKNYGELYKGLDRLKNIVGEDAHLSTLRAVGLSEEKKYDEAIEVLKDAVRAEPKYENAYWNAIKAALAKGDLDFTNKVLKSIVKNFGYTEFDFESDEIYKPFIGTEQHKDFQAFLKEKNADKK